MSDLHLYLMELVATAIFMVLGLGCCANIFLRKSGMFNSGGVVAAMGWGTAMVSVASIFAPISGAHCNPAVTIGFWLAGFFDGKLVIGYIVFQCIGAFIGAFIVYMLFKDHLDAEEDVPSKLYVFATAPSIKNNIKNCMSEAVATFTLMLILLSLSHFNPANGVAMFFVFCGVAGGVMSFGGLTGYAINPARDFMPRLIHYLLPIKDKGTSNFSYCWIPIIGPILGAAFAALLYDILFLDFLQVFK